MKSKIVILLSAFSLFLCSCQQSTPDMFAQELFSYIQHGHEPEDASISLEEYLFLIKNANNINASKKDIQEIKDNWEKDKSIYFRNFKWAGNPRIDIYTKVDSITYGYVIPKLNTDSVNVWPDGFNWPDSQKHTVDIEKFTASFINVYFSDSSGSYTLSFDVVYLHPEWKIIPIGGRMLISKIK